jgi:hypothetical protein
MINISSDEVDLLKNDWFLTADMFDFICKKHIGSGVSRTVYEFRLDSTLVVKIEKPVGEYFQFNNFSEWDIWHNINVQKANYKKFLAPCINLSSCGRIMLQKKTTPIDKKELPKLVPYFLADTKLQNWGKLNGKVVCHDYANHHFYSAAHKNKLVKAAWF